MRHPILRVVSLAMVLELIAGVGVSHLANAVEHSEASNFDYPELSVVPRSSDRLRTESEKESQTKWSTFIPIQISAATTLTAGLLSYDSKAPGAGYAGIAVGGGWLVATTLMAMYYHPYSSSHSEISKMPNGSIREQLAKERAAEEELKSAARLGQKLRWISFLSNLGTSLFILQKIGDDKDPATQILGGSNSTAAKTAQVAALVSAAASLVPIIFKSHWIDVWNEQEDYKKRIYAPVAQPTFFQEPGTQNIAPGFSLTMKF